MIIPDLSTERTNVTLSLSSTYKIPLRIPLEQNTNFPFSELQPNSTSVPTAYFSAVKSNHTNNITKPNRKNYNAVHPQSHKNTKIDNVVLSSKTTPRDKTHTFISRRTTTDVLKKSRSRQFHVSIPKQHIPSKLS